MKCEESSQKKKKDLLKKIEDQIEDSEQISKFKQLLSNGKLKKAEDLMK